MFFVLSKIVYWLVMPISLISWILIFSFFVKKKKHKRLLQGLALSLFLLFTNPLIATWVINSWEPAAVPYSEIKQQYAYGIVLSGITNPDRPPFDRIQFNKGADRIVHAVDLYKQGVIKKIVISGGSGVLTFEGRKESHQLKEYARQSDIPSEDILLEDQARNTHENAIFSAKLLNAHSSENILLITSAFHMFRAKKCFEKEGLTVSTFPTDYYGREINFTPDNIFIPSVYGFQIWSILIKEWLGIMAYKFSGYI